MSTPILRQNQGSAITASLSSIANNSYSAGTRVNNSTTAALLCDVWLTGAFGTSPAGAGSLQLVVIDRDLSGNAGAAPSTTVIGKVYTLTPSPSGTASQVFAADSIPLPYDADFYIYNNGTAYTFTAAASGFVIQPWSPGT